MTRRWLFSAPVDLALFGGTALISLVLLTAGPTSPSNESPEWAWIVGVLLVALKITQPVNETYRAPHARLTRFAAKMVPRGDRRP